MGGVREAACGMCQGVPPLRMFLGACLGVKEAVCGSVGQGAVQTDEDGDGGEAR